MKIIVNADDLGIGEKEDAATFDLMYQGKVTSATLLANGSTVQSAAKHAKKFPSCSFGVHLCLTEFHCLTTPQELTPLVDQNGEFQSNAREINIDSGLKLAIFNEWCAQVDKLLDLGVPISHFDSHHHIHTLPVLFPVLKRLQRKYRMRKVRITKNLTTEPFPISWSLKVRKQVWNTALRWHYATTTTAAFTSFSEFFQIVNNLSLLPPSIELMVHPGNPGFSEETELLCGEWKASLPDNSRLISFNDLS